MSNALPMLNIVVQNVITYTSTVPMKALTGWTSQEFIGDLLVSIRDQTCCLWEYKWYFSCTIDHKDISHVKTSLPKHAGTTKKAPISRCKLISDVFVFYEYYLLPWKSVSLFLLNILHPVLVLRSVFTGPTDFFVPGLL